MTRLARWIAALALLVAPAAAGAKEGEPPPYDVHEWGTFTSFEGSNGGGVEGLQHEEEGLPAFVYSRAEVRECPLRAVGYKGLEVPVDHVTQKMETPVLYFHAPSALRVRVRVDFVGGLISQWYPVSDLLGPPEGKPEDGALDLRTVKRSFLQWDVDVLGDRAERPAEVPEADAALPWSLARRVDASWLRTVPRKGPERMGPTEAERYLFYRGLGTFSLPHSVRAERGANSVFFNESNAHEVPAAYALEIRQDGAIRWTRVVHTGPGQGGKFSLAELPFQDSRDSLHAALGADLVAQGLAKDEADAMIATWSRQWFRSEGTRVMYLVPRAEIDDVIPLHLDPAPRRLVRVLVGRIEYATPETEAEVEAALRGRLSEDHQTALAAVARLSRLGRFEEAHIRRILADTKDPVVVESATEILKGLGQP
jgi:hypothetical protein